MTITNTDRVVSYTGNGVTTSFDFNFLIPEDTDAVVTLLTIATGEESDPLTLDVDYSVTGAGEDAGGSIEYPLSGSPLAATHKINIKRHISPTQTLDVNNQGPFAPEVLETQLDRMTMMIQQLYEESERAVKVVVGTGDDPDELIQGVLDALTDTQTAAATASAAASAAATSETNAAASEAAAAASAAAAALSETAAETAETNAAASAAAALTSETNAETAETNAAASAAAASTSATNAATSATAAQAAETNAETAQAAAEAAQTAAEAAQAAAEAAAGALTPVEDQINAATEEAFADTAYLPARKADGSLIKSAWSAIKAALQTVFDARYPLLSLLTTRGDIIYRNATTWARLPKGTSGQVLTMGANDPAWATPASSGWDMSGQSWQAVTRTHGTSYQNTTGKPIVLALSRSGTGGGTFGVQVSPNNSTWTTVFEIPALGTVHPIEVIIPPSMYYRMVTLSGTPSISDVLGPRELR